jgi:hypothetical protein
MVDTELSSAEENRLVEAFIKDAKRRGLSDKWQYDDTSQSLSAQIKESREGKREFRGAMIVRKPNGTEKRYPWEVSGFY